jgi:hypothetical protein
VIRASRATRVGAVLLIVTSTVLFGAGPAAANGTIDVSSDGIGYRPALPGALFGPHVELVPGDSESARFYLRNSGDEAGHLRITMREVASTDSDFAGALTVSASTSAIAGDPISIAAASPCWVLLEQAELAPGEVLPITTTVALGNLDGVAGQGATAHFALRVTLGDAALASLPPTDCGGQGTDVVVLPDARRTMIGTALVIHPVADTAVAGLPIPQAPTTATGVVEGLPTLSLLATAEVDPNTWHLGEELLVLVLCAALLLGSGWFLAVAWRRRRRLTNTGEA